MWYIDGSSFLFSFKPIQKSSLMVYSAIQMIMSEN